MDTGRCPLRFTDLNKVVCIESEQMPGFLWKKACPGCSGSGMSDLPLARQGPVVEPRPLGLMQGSEGASVRSATWGPHLACEEQATQDAAGEGGSANCQHVLLFLLSSCL